MEGSKMNEVSGTATGNMVIDPKTGMALESEMDQHLELSIEEEDIKVPLIMDMKVKMEQVK